MTSISDSMRRGFTLIELLVVIAMIGVIAGALTTSVSSAQERARIQKATAEVKVVAQAILAAENFMEAHKLPTMENADLNTLDFLFGKGGNDETGETMPALLQARNGDPWGKQYAVTIKSGTASIAFGSATSTMTTGFYLPNWHRLGPEERK